MEVWLSEPRTTQTMKVAGLGNLSCTRSCLRKAWEKHQQWLPLRFGAFKLKLFALVSDWALLQPWPMPSHVLLISMLTLAYRQAPWFDLGSAPFPVGWAGGLAYSAVPGHTHWPCPARLIQTLPDSDRHGSLALLADLCFWRSQPSQLTDLKIRTTSRSNPESTFSDYFCSLASTI